MLAEIHCRSFRNLETTTWRPGAGHHLLLGVNGAGKTSLLEAVYLLATTRSFRTAQTTDCARHGVSEFHLAGEIEGEQRVQLRVGLGEEGRYRSLNGSVSQLIDHLRVLPIVAWTEDDREILSGPPAKRRRFVDQGVVGSQPAALETLSRFRRILQQKRELLARRGGELATWNQLLAESAAELMRLRRQHIVRLAGALEEVRTLTGLDLPEIYLEYRPSIEVREESAELILEQLERAEERERRESRPIIGPQRDEIRITWGKHGIRRVGSAGERKAVGLLLTAARGRLLEAVGRSPLYLLDDADSDLDKDRLAAVWRVFQPARQVFVSSSRTEVWSVAPEAVRWSLEGGSVHPAQ